MQQSLDANYWQERWSRAETGWDLRGVSPPLAAYIDQLGPEARHWAVLIPGCGNGYEALYLLSHGFTDVTMLDIAPGALAQLRAQVAQLPPEPAAHLHLVCGDFFEHEGVYDLILEQTFFCALPPERRGDYARQMHRLLKPGGTLAGLLFDRDFPGGPPFGGSAAEYRQLLEPLFQIDLLAPCYNSAPPRAGTEVFFKVRKE